MNIFQFVKSQITTRQAAEHYGLNVQRNGMTLCPFHDDHTNNILNLQGRRVWGFKGIGAAIQLSDGWQKTWMETPFDEKNKIA